MCSLDASRSFVWNFARVVEANAARTVIETAQGQRLTYAQLWQRAQELRAELESQGVSQGDVVVIHLPRSTEFIAALIATWLCEAVALPLEVQMPEQRRQMILNEAQPKMVLGLRYDVPSAAMPHGRDAAYLIYTSGSTGQPKGVLVSHAGLVSVLTQQIEMFQLTAESRCLWMHGTGFDASLSDIGTALLAGAALCFDEATPHELSLIERMGITHVDLPPALLPYLDDSVRLKTIIIGGEVCAAAVIRKWAAKTRLINVYGPTEATICTSMVVCDETWGRAWIGQPIAGIAYLVCDDDGREVPTGELRISGAAVALGYPWLPELSAQRFVDDGKSYRSGDLVTRHECGGYEFLGRVDRQFKLNGRLICPEEIERALLESGFVRRVHVLPILRGTRTLLAACAEAGCAAQTLREAVQNQLPAWMLPSLWHITAAMPSLANGKPDAAAIRAVLAARPVTATRDDEPIQRLFEASLQLTGIGHDEDFFTELGGDSLAVVALMAMASECGVALPADAIHRGRTVRGVQRLVNRSEAMSRNELQREVVLDLRFATADAAPPRCILLTGATGFLGTALMNELSGDVRPLSRKNGDVRLEHFGWEAAKWRAMADEVDTVIHLAAEVKLFAPYNELKASQVEGTRNVLRFCAEGRPKTLHYASSLSVFVDADPLESLCREDDLRRDITQLHGGYAQSKWVAEQLVLRAREQGLRAAVHRLGLLSLNMQTGIGPVNDWLTLALPGLVNAPAEEALAFDLTPVDYAARVMSWLIQQQAHGVFHIANPQPVTQARIAALGEGRTSAFAALAGRRTHRSLDLFKCSRTRFDITQTTAALAGSGIDFPEITDDYLRRCLHHALSLSTP
jgi:acyl-CoA synthetase (AMP-forming)/AMP-acid ligase II/nucleoside-diphosphate-sugar epimerase